MQVLDPAALENLHEMVGGDTEFVAELIHEAFYHGLLLLPCGVSTIRFMPPLMLDQTLADEALEIFETSLVNVSKRF